ncbi:Topoisomerase 1-associated factor 1 [Nakaseomyces glabratus]|nr:Timeless protein [Nakaseomyces glabratus]QNG15231.1 uncharacterized protein GWK60_J08107 [Nakaseomyces glabratus]SCV12652.1 Topoisomerase 1-associated factor 1 [Nakaseomyces glabratus]SLM10289.1 Topoisomerase 1-associated factor 1 [Nakaseomyces glabratus]
MSDTESPLTVLKARIALLATAIGGPDYTSQIDPPPYQIGDDCLACLKDLKRWFRLVDDNQRRWDVAMAVAEYKILTDDLLPILIDWENKCYLATKLSKGNSDISAHFKNKQYYDKIALNCLQLMVLMTWPLILTEQSSTNQINLYSELKKHQLTYKKAILSVENGKVLKAAIRIAIDVIKLDRLARTPRDNMVLKMVLNFIRNILAIEPGELTITARKNIASKGINSVDTLPPNVTQDDISQSTVISCFKKNKVFPFLLTLGSSMTKEFDQDFINIPLMEVMFFLTKDISQDSLLFKSGELDTAQSENHLSKAGQELNDLLQKESQLKKKVIMNTSTRHSRFGAMLSIQTLDQKRLTVSGSQNLLDNSKALQKIDDSKKSKGRRPMIRNETDNESLPTNLLNVHKKSGTYLPLTISKYLNDFINDFIDSSFNYLLKSVTNYFVTEEDKIISLEKIEYLLFFAWFNKYQILRCQVDKDADIMMISESIKETTFILVSSLLRSSYDSKAWAVVHSSMLAFNELLKLVNNLKKFEDNEDIEYVLSRLFSDERIQLLSNLPRIASTHSLSFMKTSIELTHTVLKILEMYSGDNSLVVESKRRAKKMKSISKEDYERLVNEEGYDPDEAIEILNPGHKTIVINFKRVQSSFFHRNTIDLYINTLKRFNELEYSHIKMIISFLYRLFVENNEETLFYRLDFIILLKDMLKQDGLPRTSKARTHINDFAKYYLSRLKRKLKSSPAWHVGILFPPLNDGVVGYFQKYGEHKMTKESEIYAVQPSQFIPFEQQEMMSENMILDMQIGVLVSTLIDEGSQNLVELVRENVQHLIAVFTSHLEVAGENEIMPNNEAFILKEEYDVNPLHYNRHIRALLQLVGFEIPILKSDPCFYRGTTEFSRLVKCEESITKYLNIPFETPNGLPSSSYLKQQSEKNNSLESDGWKGNEDYDYTDPNIVPDNEVDDNDYFKDLDKSTNIRKEKRTVGIASKKTQSKNKTSRNRKKASFRLPNAIEGKDKQPQENLEVFSKEYISDSDEDDEEILNPVFFENEMYMRWLLDKYNGQLPNDKFLSFGRFVNERLSNNGKVVSDFTSLFDGPVPPIDALPLEGITRKGPDKTLLTLSRVEINESNQDNENTQVNEQVDETSENLTINKNARNIGISHGHVESEADDDEPITKKRRTSAN